MARVFLDDIDRDPPEVSHEDDIQEIETVTSAMSEYALSDDSIDEAYFSMEKGSTTIDDDDEEDEEDESSLARNGLINVAEESSTRKINEDECDETCCHPDSSLDILRQTPAREDDRYYYSYLPSIIVTEIDDFNVQYNSMSKTRHQGTFNLFEPYPANTRTRTL